MSAGTQFLNGDNGHYVTTQETWILINMGVSTSNLQSRVFPYEMQTLLDIRDFELRNFRHAISKRWKKKVCQMSLIFFLFGKESPLRLRWRKTTAGRQARGGEVMLPQIRFQCVENFDYSWTHFYGHTYIYIFYHMHDIGLVQNLQQHNNCVKSVNVCTAHCFCCARDILV